MRKAPESDILFAFVCELVKRMCCNGEIRWELIVLVSGKLWRGSTDMEACAGASRSGDPRWMIS